MAKNSIFIIDPLDQVIEVSLRKFGYDVQAFSDGLKAFHMAQSNPPELIIVENHIQGISGVELCQKLKADPKTKEIAVIFLTSEENLQVQALEAGADDFIVKPVYVGELSSRIEQTLASKQRKGVEKGKNDQFFGRLEEMALVDLFRLAEVSKRNGLLTIDYRKQKGLIYFKNGQVIDAQVGKMIGTEAIYRLLTWDKGNFVFDFKFVPDQPNRVQKNMGDLLSEGMKKLDLWSKICTQLPSLDTIFRVDQSVIANRVGDFSEINQKLLALFDGKRSILEVIDLSSYSDIDSLSAIVQLYFEALIYEVKEKAIETQLPAAFIEKNPQQSLPPEPQNFNGFTNSFDQQAFAQLTPPPPLPINTPTSMNLDLGELDADMPLPPSFTNDQYIPPPISQQFDDDPDDDLLAQLYSTKTDDDLIPPPPPPPKTELSTPDPEAAKYSSLFGFDEQGHDDFFSEVEKQEEQPAFEDQKPAQEKPKLMFIGMLVLFVGLIAAFFLRDSVKPIKENVDMTEIRLWYKAQIDKIPTPEIGAPLDLKWEIDLSAQNQSQKNVQNALNEAFNGAKNNSKDQVQKSFAQHLSDAKKYYKDQSFDDAAKSIDQALAMNSRNEEAMFLGAQIFMEQGNDQRVVDLSSRLIDMNPKNDEAYVFLGSAYQNLKQAKSAIKPYEDYLRLNPDGKHANEIRNLLEQIRRQSEGK